MRELPTPAAALDAGTRGAARDATTDGVRQANDVAHRHPHASIATIRRPNRWGKLGQPRLSMVLTDERAPPGVEDEDAWCLG